MIKTRFSSSRGQENSFFDLKIPQKSPIFSDFGVYDQKPPLGGDFQLSSLKCAKLTLFTQIHAKLEVSNISSTLFRGQKVFLRRFLAATVNFMVKMCFTFAFGGKVCRKCIFHFFERFVTKKVSAASKKRV